MLSNLNRVLEVSKTKTVLVHSFMYFSTKHYKRNGFLRNWCILLLAYINCKQNTSLINAVNIRYKVENYTNFIGYWNGTLYVNYQYFFTLLKHLTTGKKSIPVHKISEIIVKLIHTCQNVGTTYMEIYNV